MDLTMAVLVEDQAAQRRLIARALRRAGWTVHAASNSVDGERLAARILAGPDAARTLILTDLHMSQDPYAAERAWAAGAYFALRLRSRMACGELPRAPIVALSDTSAREIHLTALALGCDAVVEKSAPLDLPARIKATLEPIWRPEADPAGFDAMLRLLGLQLDSNTTVPVSPALALTPADINTALLAYRRYGCLGLGKSPLARYLSPLADCPLRRGEHAYAEIVRCLDEMMRLGGHEMAATLCGELERNLAPADHKARIALSKTTYYRRRQEAVQALLGLLTRGAAGFLSVDPAVYYRLASVWR